MANAQRRRCKHDPSTDSLRYGNFPLRQHQQGGPGIVFDAALFEQYAEGPGKRAPHLHFFQEQEGNYPHPGRPGISTLCQDLAGTRRENPGTLHPACAAAALSPGGLHAALSLCGQSVLQIFRKTGPQAV